MGHDMSDRWCCTPRAAGISPPPLQVESVAPDNVAIPETDAFQGICWAGRVLKWVGGAWRCQVNTGRLLS